MHIYCRITIDNQRATPYSTGVTCKAKQWDQKGQKIKASSPTAAQDNDRLQAVKALAIVVFNDIVASGKKVTADMVREKVARGTVPQLPTLLQLYKALILWKKGVEKVSAGTIRTYQIRMGNLKGFLDAEKLSSKPFDGLPAQLQTSYLRWLMAKGNGPDFSNKCLQDVDACIAHGMKEGKLKENHIGKADRLKNKEPDMLHHTAEDVAKLETCPFANEYLRNSVACFLIACYQGFRHGELKKFMDNPEKHYTPSPTTGKIWVEVERD